MYYDTNSEAYRMLFGRNDHNTSSMPIYDGQPLSKEDTVLNQTNESNYLVQGAIELGDENILEGNDSTFGAAFVNEIINAPGSFVFGNLFNPRLGGNFPPGPVFLPQPPLIRLFFNNSAYAPPDTTPPYSLLPGPDPRTRGNVIRREMLAQPMVVRGLRILAETAFDAQLPLEIENREVNGKVKKYVIQPSQYTSPSNPNPNIIDIPDFGIVMDSNTIMRVGKSREVSVLQNPYTGQPGSFKLLMFTTIRQSDITNNFFSKSVVRSLKAKRPLGIPLYDENSKPIYHVIKNNPFKNKSEI